MTSACLNPLLYALINDSFRAAFVQLVRPLLLPCTSVVVEQQRSTLFNNSNHPAQQHTFSSALANRKTNTTAIDSSHPSKVLRGRSPLATEASYTALCSTNNGNGMTTARHATLSTTTVPADGGTGAETCRLLDPRSGGVSDATRLLLSPSPSPPPLIRVLVEEERTRLMPPAASDDRWRRRLSGLSRTDEEDEEEEDEDGRTTTLL
ncbi:hypothetical protein niasHT_036347 [Heterodera trifolii]|uniref:G-protein coupled receptors family 1 profile domain-containing protein n=1 Tax=Heterodera trifolii TaxID=157864 RepID=A0ABD2J0Y1_9BILA